MLVPSFAAAALTALASFASASPVNSAGNGAPAQTTANLTSQFQPIIAPVTPPEFKWLYTAIVKCPADLLRGDVGPYGQRKAIPIVGGYLEGPGINGTFRNLGADWGVVDPRSGIFTADTRYNAVLSDGSDLYFNTFGPKTQDGSLHLHIKIETGSAAYYHLNHVVAVGVLHNLGHDDLNVSTLRIDAFDFKTDYTNLTLLH
ncbi:hypothetical protein NBRC10512_000100 [Rhodotorula toruloides]|uniref:RHTO0S09e06062g1_1 n=1 Tax=Rhodotorula toruloides TaxID=5286 RepID=A0A061B9J9_RHOTO|nr:hypothetical protein OF846_004095 [Rhodotorula toruloides]CDR44550.1 RHTO0S09e06062g1_1 [Rhodotorula toruloides]